MSTEVSIYGLTESCGVHCGRQSDPRIAEYHHEMGLSNLAGTLDYVAQGRPDLLQEYTEDRPPGLRQFLVLSAQALVNHIEKNPHVWPAVGVGFESGLELMREHPDLTWWFHVCS